MFTLPIINWNASLFWFTTGISKKNIWTSYEVVYLINTKTFNVILKFENKKIVCLNSLWT
jgi:hypothetical protein